MFSFLGIDYSGPSDPEYIEAQQNAAHELQLSSQIIKSEIQRQPQIGWLGKKINQDYSDILQLVNNERWLKYPHTKNCYLDGRYFAIVFKNLDNVFPQPLTVDIDQGDTIVSLPKMHIKDNMLVRVVVNINNEIKHSCLLIFENKNKVIYFNPIELSHSEEEKYELDIRNSVDILGLIIHKYLLIHNPHIKMFTEEEIINKESNSKCNISGFCNAHVIKRAACHLLNKRYEPYDITQFASMIEHNYILSSTEEPEIEFGMMSSGTAGALVGGAIGLGVGGLIGGPVGAVAGLGVGALGGYALSTI